MCQQQQQLEWIASNCLFNSRSYVAIEKILTSFPKNIKWLICCNGFYSHFGFYSLTILRLGCVKSYLIQFSTFFNSSTLKYDWMNQCITDYNRLALNNMIQCNWPSFSPPVQFPALPVVQCGGPARTSPATSWPSTAPGRWWWSRWRRAPPRWRTPSFTSLKTKGKDTR